MEQRKDVHYEIQRENSDGVWAELLQERPKTEEEIPERCHRAQAANPGEKIRAVKVTTTVTVENVSDELRSGIPAANMDGRERYVQDRVYELLQDCD